VQKEDVILYTTLEELDACQPLPLVVFMSIQCWNTSDISQTSSAEPAADECHCDSSRCHTFSSVDSDRFM